MIRLIGMSNKTTFADAVPDVLKHFGTHLAVAKTLGYSDLRNVSAWMKGERPFPPEHCVTLEKESEKALTRQRLRPEDWERYWPELATEPAKAG